MRKFIVAAVATVLSLPSPTVLGQGTAATANKADNAAALVGLWKGEWHSHTLSTFQGGTTFDVKDATLCISARGPNLSGWRVLVIPQRSFGFAEGTYFSRIRALRNDGGKITIEFPPNRQQGMDRLHVTSVSDRSLEGDTDYSITETVSAIGPAKFSKLDDLSRSGKCPNAQRYVAKLHTHYGTPASIAEIRAAFVGKTIKLDGAGEATYGTDKSYEYVQNGTRSVGKYIISEGIVCVTFTNKRRRCDAIMKDGTSLLFVTFHGAKSRIVR